MTLETMIENLSLQEKMTALDKMMIALSDIISFHSYEDGAKLEMKIKQLSRYNRPLLCTEYMARGNNSTFASNLPVAKQYKVAALNWGFVAGKTQTETLQRAYGNDWETGGRGPLRVVPPPPQFGDDRPAGPRQTH